MLNVLSENKILNETKNHNPPLQVKWSVTNNSSLFSDKNQQLYKGSLI